ncbi:MAG: hypothetical protein ABI222_08625 [Opitutaceae bacterium]
MKNLSLGRTLLPVLVTAVLLLAPARASAQSVAVWLDGSLTDGGNGIPNRISSLGYTVTLVSTADLENANFLASYDAIVLSRYGSNFGTYLTAAAATNVSAYVGHGASQGGVAIFTNDLADNLGPSGHGGDPFDPNLDALFVNAVTFAAASHHGFIGEFNGAVMAMDSNTAGAPALGFFQGSADSMHGFGPDFTYGVGPIGAGNPIDAGVTFPFTDTDHSTYLTTITGADPANIVDIYTNDAIAGTPAVLANGFVIHGGGMTPVPEPSTYGLCGSLLVAGLAFYRKMKRGVAPTV